MKNECTNSTIFLFFQGSSGYIYSLKWVSSEEIYVATLLTDIHLSNGLTLLYDDMLSTMTALYGFKVYNVFNSLSFINLAIVYINVLVYIAYVIINSTHSKGEH